ncbi:hypothetical protein [Paracandidimonas soli]|uniref:DUF4376 domain-containing protein n=1 Tax=Paracandidimonas soli TaxID=1917182 RepID=A0A4R3VAF9_9BURK|nr:hypothetical protein [Paracandidimonas soli]TCV00518.1 hypothetical protein EV686_10398 [Paracandidimonas soli]
MSFEPILVSRIDPQTMLFVYNETVQAQPDGEYQVPGNCILVLAPEVGENECPKWITDLKKMDLRFGHPGTGSWEVVQDYRQAELYRTDNGDKYELGSDVDSVSYDGIGELPAWLTLEARPSRFHHYIDGAWVLDDQEELEALINDKVTELSIACQARIYAGFESSALGQEHHYPAMDKDQQNLTASVLDSTVPGLPEGWATPFWCEIGGEWAFRLHTAEQIQAVGRAGKAVILACMAQNSVLANAARNAKNKAVLADISWSDPDLEQF